MVPKKTDFYINFKGWTYLRRGRRYCNGWWSDQGMNTIIFFVLNFSHHFFQVFRRSSLGILGGISRWIGLPFCFTPITSSSHVFTNPESTKPDIFFHEMCRLLWSVLNWFSFTGKSISKELASSNPQYDTRLFIELLLRYMLCTQIVFCFNIQKNCVHNMYWVCSFYVLNS